MCCCLYLTGRAQSFVTGSFSSRTTDWGCSLEANTESVYGEPGAKAVDEVDAAANICQTVSGFAIGSSYSLRLLASRRTGGCPSPATNNMNITIDGGALAVTLTRTNTTFGLTTAVYVFTATNNAHTITFSAGSGFGSSTCGMIVDNIALGLSSFPLNSLIFMPKRGGRKWNYTGVRPVKKTTTILKLKKAIKGPPLKRWPFLLAKPLMAIAPGDSTTWLTTSPRMPERYTTG
jgi:hypothetical protein